MNKIPKKYIPDSLTDKDKKKAEEDIKKSRKSYKKGQFKKKRELKSFVPKKSSHIQRAKKIYNVDAVKSSNELAKASGCSQNTLKKIVRKGKGAFYSSGSRPNQTPESWGRARLASALTGGKSSKIDKKELLQGCKKGSKALKLMKK